MRRLALWDEYYLRYDTLLGSDLDDADDEVSGECCAVPSCGMMAPFPYRADHVHCIYCRRSTATLSSG